MNDCCTYLDPDIQQAPSSSIIYTVDWPSRGLPSGVTIASQQFFPAGATDYTISNESIVDGGLQTSFELTGGIPGTYYGINNRITLSDGEIMNATLIFQCVFQETRRWDTCI